MDEQAVRLAQRVAVVVSAGFAFGGVIGIVYAEDDPAREVLAFAMLAALFGLHLRNCVRRADGRRPRGWPWTLAAQVVLTAAGLAWFAGTWYGNTGFLAAAVLLLIRRPWARWGGFALVLAGQFLSALTVRPTVGEALYLVVGQAAFVGIALYGVVRLADLITDLRGTQAALAAAAVAGERLAFAEQLNQRIGAGLERVVRHGPVDTALAAVLREGVTNVLRHSDARRCALEVTADDRGVRLRLANDGATAAPSRAAGDGAPGHRSGAGIGNLTDRLGELGGRLRIEATGDDYALVAEVPLQPALVGGDADRVDPVPGVELRDR